MKQYILSVLLYFWVSCVYGQSELTEQNYTETKLTPTVVDGVQEALRYIVLSQKKIDKKYTNTIKIYNQQSELIKTIDAGTSSKNGGQIFHFDDPNRFYFYAYENKSKAHLNIYDKTDFSLIASHQIQPLYEELIINQDIYRLAELNKDKTRLFMHVGKKKTQSILILDVKTGAVVKQIPLGKYKAKVTTHNNGDTLLAVVNTGKNRGLKVIDTQTGAVSFEKTYKYKDVDGFVYGDYVIYAYVSGEQLDKVYHYFIRNYKSDQLLDFRFKSSSQFTFTQTEDNTALYFAGKEVDSQLTTVFTFKQGQATQLPLNDLTITPKLLKLDNDESQLLVLGKSDLTVLSLKDNREPKLTDLPFDIGDIIFDNSGNRLYLKEGAGSEVALVDVASGKKVASSGTGRRGVKFGQFMASAALMGVGLNHGYMIFSARFSRTGMILNHSQNRLFVINSKTNDVTLFNAHDLSGREAIATGRSTYFIYQMEDEQSPALVLSENKINWLNGKTGQLITQTEIEQLSGLHLDHGLLFSTGDEQTRVYSMKNGELLTTINESDVRMVNVL